MSEQQDAQPQKIRRTQVGRVVTNVSHKTIAVLVERQVKHPMYEKTLRRARKFQAHDEDNACQVGDLVVIEECRPISKTKAWRLKSILQRAGA